MPVAKQGQLLRLCLLVATVFFGAQGATAAGLAAPTSADTVRTNLWLTEALMGQIVVAAAVNIPPAPAAVRLEARESDDPRDAIFQNVAAGILGEAGYDLFVTEDDPARQGAVDYVFSYGVQDVDLSYPEVGRTLGIWRRWVARELAVSVQVEISEESSGRLLLSERMERRYGDRFDSDDFDNVDAGIYDFTTAATSESGWKNRTEEIVVLGTLAGLVAIYFANTGN